MTGPFAFCGIGVARRGQRQFAISQQPFLRVDADSPFRVASVSKLVVGQALAGLLAEKGLSWATPAQDVLGWSLSHPDDSNAAVTIGQLAGHSSGLTDDGGYLLAENTTLAAHIRDTGVWSSEPGTYFRYSNLGYIILGEVIEALSGREFPDAVAAWVPEGGSFNWAGAGAGHLRAALPTYRRDGQRFLPQIDAPPVLPKPSGTVARFSPQGGLRLSLSGMLDLAERLPQADQTVLWRHSDGPGDYLDGVFADYGAGLQIFANPSFYPRPLIGHFGNAYGFNGGVWYDAETGTSFAYALNGLELGDEDDSFSAAELAIFAAVAAQGG